jgi:F0F1-type ATP synthase delta subunit
MQTPLSLPPNIVSPQDLARLEVEITQFADWFHHNAIKQEMHIAKGTAMPGMTPECIALLRTVSQNGTLVQTSLDALQLQVRGLRQTAATISVTLAAPAGAQLKQQITEWCRRELDPSMLVDFRFNSTILGGMVVRYGSHVFDWSFRRAILAKRQEFAEVLRRV